MILGRLIKGLDIPEMHGDPGVEIGGLAYDSRKVRPGDLFVALKGRRVDGHEFIEEAVKRGSAAVVCEGFRDLSPGKAAVIRVGDAHEALSRLAVNFYDYPFRKMRLIGITGTNGKTTTSYLLEAVLAASGAKPGVIGTVNYRIPGQVWSAPVTTPESLDLMRTLRLMADEEVSHVIMEVSSHAIEQGRTRGCPFRVAVFTNFSRDHLDYHGSLDAYFQAKARLFRSREVDGRIVPGHAVINGDDARAPDLLSVTDSPVMTYGVLSPGNLKAERLRVEKNGLSATIRSPAGDMEIESSLVGEFNVYNILAAAGAALCMGVSPEHVRQGIKSLKGIPGRLERVENGRSLTILVDYAHTPDALSKVLGALRPVTEGRIITVFGCGGDRDKGERGEMGRVAGEAGDLVIITSDNPRTEDPADIAGPIERGVRETGLEFFEPDKARKGRLRGYSVELDRRRAIELAVGVAEPRDVVLIAGKGHEDYQIVGTAKRPFDDRKVASEAISAGAE